MQSCSGRPCISCPHKEQVRIGISRTRQTCHHWRAWGHLVDKEGTMTRSQGEPRVNWWERVWQTWMLEAGQELTVGCWYGSTSLVEGIVLSGTRYDRTEPRIHFKQSSKADLFLRLFQHKAGRAGTVCHKNMRKRWHRIMPQNGR